MTTGPDLPSGAPPSREALTAVVTRYADRASDAARRLGANSDQARIVVERAAVAVIDEAATHPRTVGDLGGRWFREIRSLVSELRAEGLTEVAPSKPRRGAKVDPLETALAALDERRLLALLLRDSYDLPFAAVAAGLGLAQNDAATVVAEARLRLLEALEGQPAPTLAGHPAASGISFGALGRHADGSLGSEDPAHPERLRHVQTCAVCAGFIDAQRRARRAVAGLHVNALDDGEHDALVTKVDGLAATRLPAQAVVAAAIAASAPSVGPSLVTVGVFGTIIALVVGAAIGVATASGDDSGGSGATVAATSGAPGVAIAKPSPSPSPSPSPVSSFSPLPVVSPSPSPSRARATSKAPVSRAPSPSPAAPSSEAPSPSPAEVPVSITLSPSSGPADSTVNVSGVGFSPNATVTVTYSYALGGGSSVTTVASGSGTFSTNIVAHDPSLAPQPQHQITASDGPHSSSATFTVTG